MLWVFTWQHTTKSDINTFFNLITCCPLSFVFVFCLCIENLLFFDVRIGVYEMSNFTECSPLKLKYFFQRRCQYAERIPSMAVEGKRAWDFGGMRSVVVLFSDNNMY